ncbi:DUF1599 domain-containing protein [Halocola ammonii]
METAQKVDQQLEKTSRQYDEVIEKCKSLFDKKMSDYGSAWRVLRPSSLTDQIFIKAQRIRTLQETKQSKVEEDVESEFIAIINYCVMALIQLQMSGNKELELDLQEASELYSKWAADTKDLMMKKNHDYGEAWRDMRVSSITDLILMKLLRTKQIEDNAGKTLVSEGIDANYMDMLNYAAFALIRIGEGEDPLA